MAALSEPGRRPGLLSALAGFLPGLVLCAAISAAAVGLEHLEAAWVGRAWVEALVIAILAGAAVRTAWTPGPAWKPGIRLSAKFLLEVAVVLLGATLSAQALAAAGPALLAGIVAVVALALAASYGLGRLLGLNWRMAVLIACGNSICGNSAIAAVAPIIRADGDDVAGSIAFTAVLGVGVVLILPLAGSALALSHEAYGILSGLTVYAVPQVVAATLPVSALSAEVGTLVKLTRVLMLGPVVLALSLIALRPWAANEARPDRLGAARWPKLRHLIPWFITGFLLLAAARSVGLIPEDALAPARQVSGWLMILSMAALGLGVDIRSVARSGPRVTVVVILSLLVLALISLLLIRLLGIG